MKEKCDICEEDKPKFKITVTNEGDEVLDSMELCPECADALQADTPLSFPVN